jgi:hypothetical protein
MYIFMAIFVLCMFVFGALNPPFCVGIVLLFLAGQMGMDRDFREGFGNKFFIFLLCAYGIYLVCTYWHAWF